MSGGKPGKERTYQSCATLFKVMIQRLVKKLAQILVRLARGVFLEQNFQEIILFY